MAFILTVLMFFLNLVWDSNQECHVMSHTLGSLTRQKNNGFVVFLSPCLILNKYLTFLQTPQSAIKPGYHLISTVSTFICNPTDCALRMHTSPCGDHMSSSVFFWQREGDQNLKSSISVAPITKPFQEKHCSRKGVGKNPSLPYPKLLHLARVQYLGLC